MDKAYSAIYRDSRNFARFGKRYSVASKVQHNLLGQDVIMKTMNRTVKQSQMKINWLKEENEPVRTNNEKQFGGYSEHEYVVGTKLKKQMKSVSNGFMEGNFVLAALCRS